MSTNMLITTLLKLPCKIFCSYLLALLPLVIGALPSEFDSLFDHKFDEQVAHFAVVSGGSRYVVKAKEESKGMHSRMWGNWCSY